MADYVDQGAAIQAALTAGQPAGKAAIRAILTALNAALAGIGIGYREIVGETGVINPWYLPGDARRYGIWPGDVNWERDHGSKVAAWMRSCILPGVIGLLPPGYYATGLNWSSLDLAGARVRLGGAIIGGIFHVQSSPTPQAGDAKLIGLRFYGDFQVTDRLGINNAADIKFDRVRLLSDPSRNTSTPGSKGRGCHIHFGCDDIAIDELQIDDCEAGHNCDAALAIDGNGDNPERIRIRRVHIRGSDCHGAYITGFDHDIGELRVDGYAATGPERDVQDADAGQSLGKGRGVWINRASGDIGTIIVGQPASSRPNAMYDVCIDETGLNDARHLRVGRVDLTAVGAGSAAARGMCVGDREYAGGAAQINVSIGSIRAQVAAGAVLAAGYQVVQINQRAGGTRVEITGGIEIINPGVNQGVRVEAGARLTMAGPLRYHAGGGASGARGTALEVLGFVQAPGGVEYQGDGSSLDVPAVIWSAAAGSICGPVTCSATSSTTKKALYHTATGTRVGPVTSSNLQSGGGTIAVNGGSNATILLGAVTGTGITSGWLGIRLTGAITDLRLEGGVISNFSIGIAKGTATLTRLSTLNVVSTANAANTNSNLAAADVTQIGACSGVIAP